MRLNSSLHKQTIALLVIVLGFACCQAWALTDTQGRTVNPDDWRNKWVIINYWADWCDPCLEEIPQLNLFYQRHHDQVILYGVNYDDLSGNRLLAAMRSLHIEFPVLQTDPAKQLKLPSFAVLPTTFILNPEGKMVKRLSGPQTAARLEELTHVNP
jgi:thiol-disulfide isomerase/thioredoxin